MFARSVRDLKRCVVQEAALDRVKQDVKRNRELIDKDGDLPQEYELYSSLAEAANSLTAKDNLIQVRHIAEYEIVSLSITRYWKCNLKSVPYISAFI